MPSRLRLHSKEVAARVSDLMSGMTLEQKIGQMLQTERLVISPQQVRDYHVGSVLSGGGSVPGDNLPADWVAMNDAYWAASMERDTAHLAIPVIYGVDAIHGNNNVRGATVFPHNIGLGAAGDPDLIRRIAEVTAREILATGVDWTFAPTLAVARDIRWGRSYESYSEDPDIVSRFSAAFVAGMQGDLGDDGVVACLKHWVGDGGTGHGVDQGETMLPFDELDCLHIAPYRPALEQGALSVMVSFNSWNGDKCHGHRWLITDVLKGDLGFAGLVISDWDGVDYLDDDFGEAIALGVDAGIDVFMVSQSWREFIQCMQENVTSGRTHTASIDEAVRRILTVKFAFGLFDKPRPAARVWSNHASFGSESHREVAREAVRKSLVLLKNKSDTLPVSRHARVLVAGKNADDCGHQCGGFTIAWQGTSGNEFVEGGTSIWSGIREAAPAAELSPDGSAADAARHDIAIVVVGELPYAEGLGDIRDGDRVIVETGSQIKGSMKVLAPYGSSLALSRLHPEDLSVISGISDKGIPIVCVLVSGRPLVVNEEMERADAFVAAWLPGSEGGGIADVLFGDFDFEGRLSFSWPRQDGPQPNYGDTDYDPLFPYGYGLSYRG